MSDLTYEESISLSARTLAAVNAIRRGVGLSELPRLRRGKKGDGCHCPIANSLYEVYSGCGVEPNIGGSQVEFPQAAAERLAASRPTIPGGELIVDESDFGGLMGVEAEIGVFSDFISRFDGGELPKLDEENAGPDLIPELTALP